MPSVRLSVFLDTAGRGQRKITRPLCDKRLFVFICGLFNDIVRSSDYTIYNGMMISE
jgi:hypothetical protein